MTLLRTDPRAVPPRRHHARRRAWWLAASVLVHAAVLAALLLRPAQERVADTEPSYELVFSDGSPPGRSASEQPAPEQTPSAPAPDSAPEQPTPLEPPAPSEAPAPEPAPEAPPPAPVPEPPPDLPAPEPAPPDPAPPAPAPLQPEPTPPPDPVPVPDAPRLPATVRLAEPEPLAPTLTPQSLVPDLALDVPPMPPPRPPAPPRQAQPRPAPDRRFASPLDLNFGQALSRPPPPAARGTVASRAIDLSLGAPKPGPNKSEAFYDARAAKVGADWANGLAAYWRRHRFYPRQAAESGEDGTVQVELVVNRLGKVESVEISRRSGSPWLDMAALSTWRSAQLAPFPAENTDPRVTITLTINYILLR